MGIFDNIEEIDETVEVVEEASVQKKSAFIKESGAFAVTMKKFYYTQNDNGTTFFNFEAETADGQKITHKEWFITKDGRTQFDEKDFKTKEKTGKKKDFEGFARLKVIVRALTGGLDWKTTEKKTIGIYDYNAKAEVDTEVDMLMPVIGKEVEILVRRVLEDKSQLNPATGKYEPIAEFRAINEIRGWLDQSTHKSYAETMANKEPKSYEAFMKAIEEEPILDRRDKSKNIDVNAPKEDKPASEEATQAFA